MSVETGIKAKLDGALGVTAIVGTAISFGMRTQGVDVPSVVFEVTAEESVELDQSLRIADLSVYCVAATPIGSTALADAVRTALDGMTGTADDVTVSATIYLGRTIEPGTVGNGDDDDPSVAQVLFHVYYS